jgi:hypothetical protein
MRSVLSAANSESAAKSFAVPSTHSAVASRPTPANRALTAPAEGVSIAP